MLIQIVILLSLGSLGFVWAAIHGHSINLNHVLTKNHLLLTMIISVSFLRLVSLPDASKDEVLPKGPRAYLRTMLGLHLFGSVINISTVLIILDKLCVKRQLTLQTGKLASRAFSACAFWSPLFAAMGIALTYAPGAEVLKIISVGIPLAVCSLIYIYLSGRYSDPQRLKNFEGYPMGFGNLWLPLVLAVGVLILHQIYPGTSVLVFNSLLSPLLAIAVLSVRRGLVTMVRSINRHINQNLPTMYGEVTLFLAAGVLAVGLGQFLATFENWIPYSQFNAFTASMTLLVIVGFAIMGIHPIISVSTVAIMLEPIHAESTLLAIMFLMSWAIGVSCSPLSGLHVLIQGRYGISAWKISKSNIFYGSFMLCVSIITLHIYQNF